MTKQEAIELLGGSVGAACKAVGISSSAVSQWPDVLSDQTTDRVIAALVRLGKPVPSELTRGTSEQVSA
jgi:hypothetical protein